MKVNFPSVVHKLSSINSLSYNNRQIRKSGYASDCFIKNCDRKEINSFEDINSFETRMPTQVVCKNTALIPTEKKQDFAKRLFDVLAEGSIVEVEADRKIDKYMKRAGFCKARPKITDLGKKTVYEKQKGWTTLNTLVKDKNGKWVEAKIIKSINESIPLEYRDSCSYEYTMEINKKVVAESLIMNSNLDATIYLSSLFLKNAKEKKYKGVGTELLKCAVQESRNRGFGGAISLLASYQPPPFIFYYKNNFKACSDGESLNPAIDYAAKNNLEIDSMIPLIIHTCEMILDEKSADAFLKGQRLYEQRPSYNFSEKTIDGVNYAANLVQFDDKEYYIQIIDKDSKYNKFKTSVTIKVLEDDAGEYADVTYHCNPHIDVDADVQLYLNKTVRSFAKSLKIARIMPKYDF